jgi:hypothetical protein
MDIVIVHSMDWASIEIKREVIDTDIVQQQFQVGENHVIFSTMFCSSIVLAVVCLLAVCVMFCCLLHHLCFDCVDA